MQTLGQEQSSEDVRLGFVQLKSGVWVERV